MKWFAAATLLATIAVSTSFGSLYRWNTKKRVPISLREALDRAEKLLGEDAKNRYCVDVALYGNRAGDGTGGAWNLWYAAADGSTKHVFISMDGKSEVKVWSNPIDWAKHEGRRTSLEDVKGRLEKLFAKHGMEATLQLDRNSLTVRYKTRVFRTYNKNDLGHYADTLTDETGPTAQGFFIRCDVISSFERGWHDGYFERGPYWQLYKRIHLMARRNSFLKVEVRYGEKPDHQITRELFHIFGEEARDL